MNGRRDQRRQLREDARNVERGLDGGNPDNEQLFSLTRVLRDRVRTAIVRRSVTSLMHFLYENMRAGSAHLAGVPIACGRGCSHCCNIWVDATPPEVFYTVGAMNRRQREVALEAVTAALELTAGKTFDERSALVTPCPLLAQDLCSTYLTRPMNCRTAVSTDAAICQRAYVGMSGENIPTPFVWFRMRQGYGVALQCALEHAGLAAQAREWNESLRIALTDPDAEVRWFDGDDPFAGAPTVQEAEAGRDLLDQLMARALGH